MKNKYDFGYDLHPDSTNRWAFDHIKPNSKILELGPSNGNLIYNLTTRKNCVADIVEMDEHAGKEASAFARVSCIGELEGNIEQEVWKQKIEGNQYDYVVILDVLEHVRNPVEVLRHVGNMLREDGKVLLSIPNIAHNSVLINLLNNKFEYTPIGLLDDTHIHFYTYESLQKMIHDAGLVTVRKEVRQKQVSENEIDSHYGQLPTEVESFLKTRPMGTAYQFLFTLQKGTVQPDIPLEYCEDKHYEVVVFDEETVVFQEKNNPIHPFSAQIKINKPTRSLRIDPLDKNCILKKWSVIGYSAAGTTVDVEELSFTGNQINGTTVFYADDPQIYIRWSEEVDCVQLDFTYGTFDSDGLRELAELRDYVRELERSNEYLRQNLSADAREGETVDMQRVKRQEMIELLKNGNKKLTETNRMLRDNNEQLLLQMTEMKQAMEREVELISAKYDALISHLSEHKIKAAFSVLTGRELFKEENRGKE